MRTTAPVRRPLRLRPRQRHRTWSRPWLWLWLLLPQAGCDRATELRFDDDPEGIVTIAQLKARGAAAEAVALTEDLSVRGRVVSSDRYGEFSRELVVEDASGGITLAAGHPSLADAYPFGTLVTIRCNGLWLCDYGGKIVLGGAPGAYGPTPVAQTELPSRIHVEPAPGEAPEAAPITLDAITQRRVDTYVRIEGVRFAEAEVCWCDTDPETGRTATTVREFVDGRGGTFRVRTLGTCRYANEPVPSGTGSLQGIVDYFGGSYSLRLVNRGAEFPTPEASPTACP